MAGAEPPSPMLGREQPARADVAGHPRLHVMTHPLAAILTTTLRDARTPVPAFGHCVQELARGLLWETLADVATAPVDVPGHSGVPVAGRIIAGDVALVVILRAGLGMLPPARELLPLAPVYQVGARRDEATLAARIYYTNLPCAYDDVARLLVLDPMLATGGSASAVVRLLRPAYRGPIAFLGILGAPLGARELLASDPDVDVYLAALDDHLDQRGFIVPGLGDAGDRLFGTE
ncbi:MAG TPA: uracil phosphoribosyltransferase [Thermomicrobiaceae bacterium]|nr:uracil phosphoribosyltransferase [Thermomicrobiaceae bacterium]